jgi:hypothetical protein
MVLECATSCFMEMACRGIQHGDTEELRRNEGETDASSGAQLSTPSSLLPHLRSPLCVSVLNPLSQSPSQRRFGSELQSGGSRGGASRHTDPHLPAMHHTANSMHTWYIIYHITQRYTHQSGDSHHTPTESIRLPHSPGCCDVLKTGGAIKRAVPCAHDPRFSCCPQNTGGWIRFMLYYIG